MPGGRPTKLDSTVTDIIVGAIQNHGSAEDACDLAGISTVTLHNWLVKGEKQKSGPYREFFNEIKKARAFAKIELLQKINADPSWQSKAWLLERKYPKEYGRAVARDPAIDGPTGPLAPGGDTTEEMDVLVMLTPPADGKPLANPYAPPPRSQPKTVEVQTLPPAADTAQ